MQIALDLLEATAYYRRSQQGEGKLTLADERNFVPESVIRDGTSRAESATAIIGGVRTKISESQPAVQKK